MSQDPVTYGSHPSLCRGCISRQEFSLMLTGYCMTARCDGCGRLTDVAMVKLDRPLVPTGQNRPYSQEVLLVRATLTVKGIPSTWDFDWNDRESVRRFAADSDRCIRAGGNSTLQPL